MRRGEGIADRGASGSADITRMCLPMRLVVSDVQIMEFVAAIITDQPRRLLEMRRLEIHDGFGAVAVRLLAPRHQRLA